MITRKNTLSYSAGVLTSVESYKQSKDNYLVYLLRNNCP